MIHLLISSPHDQVGAAITTHVLLHDAGSYWILLGIRVQSSHKNMQSKLQLFTGKGAMLAPIRLTNAAAQLHCGSGETQGEASPPPVRTTPAPTRLYTGKGAMQASSPPIRTAPAPTRLIERVAHWWKLV